MKKVISFSLFLILVLAAMAHAEISIKEKFSLESHSDKQGRSEEILLIIPSAYYDSLQEKQEISAPFRLPFTVTIDNISGNEINLYHFYRMKDKEEENITKFLADQNTENLKAKNIEYHEIHGIPTLSPPPVEKGKLEFDLEIPLIEEMFSRDSNGRMQVSFSLSKRPVSEGETATVSFFLAKNEFAIDHDIKFDTDGNPQMFFDIFDNNTVINVYANSLDPMRIEKNATEGSRNAVPFIRKGNTYKIALKIEPLFAEENTFITPQELNNETQFIAYDLTKLEDAENYSGLVQEIEEVTISGTKLLREILQNIHEKTNRSVNYEDGRGISITFEGGDDGEKFTTIVYDVIQEKLQDQDPSIEAKSWNYVIRYNKDLGTQDFRIAESQTLKQKEDVLSRYKLQPDRYPTAIKKLQKEIDDLKQNLIEHEGKFLDPSTIEAGSIIYFPVNLG
jgi:hypothetical protein